VAYKPSKRRRHSISDMDLNLTPVMNLFMVIIPFLLLIINLLNRRKSGIQAQ